MTIRTPAQHIGPFLQAGLTWDHDTQVAFATPAQPNTRTARSIRFLWSIIVPPLLTGPSARNGPA